MVDKATILQIIGALMKHPQYLSETDKYRLTPDDFSSLFEKYIFSAIYNLYKDGATTITVFDIDNYLDDFYYRFHKYIFVAIDNLYRNGASRIQPIDIENYLATNESAKVTFQHENGIEYLQDADYLSEEQNFPYYYKRLKKINLLNSFKDKGINTDEFYIENALSDKDLKINEKFEALEIEDILEVIKKKILGIERNFIQNDTTETVNVFHDITQIIQNASNQVDVGPAIQGEIFNEVIAGARKGIFVLRSGGSGVSKTRQAVGDACYLAFPFRYEEDQDKWVQTGNNKKVLFIATEQSVPEIQKMVLAYLTGFNETKFRYGGFTDKEQKIIQQAITVLEMYQDNLLIVRMPNPTIELVKTIVRENVLMHDIEYVFYDYIFISPSLLNEFKGFNLRNDKLLSCI